MAYIAKYNLQTNIYIYIYKTMTNHSAPRMTQRWVNPYFHYGPLYGGGMREANYI